VDAAKEETHKLGRRATVVNKMRNFAVELADKGRHLKGIILLTFKTIISNDV